MKTFKDYIISEKQQRILQQEYLDTNYALINAKRPANSPDSLHYYYDLDILMSYLEYVKKTAESQGKSDVKIRFTMGKYPENPIDAKQNPAYANHQTLFFNAITVNNQKEDETISGIEAMDFFEIVPPPRP